jgi:lipoprotein-anchoring transpeptidase ErfK/SrfK
MRSASILLMALAVLATTAATATAASPASRMHAPTATAAWTGELVAPTVFRAAPSGGARRVTKLSAVGPIGGDSTALLVTGVARTNGAIWARVLLPKRPNGRQGWVRASHLRLRRTTARVEIDLTRRRVTLFRGTRVIFSAPAVVGKASTPTPKGLHAVAELITTNAPDSFLGPYVLALTAFSETLNEFEGGDGRVAIHGTSQPSLLGSRVSHGCIRVSNGNVTTLARIARPGTPVYVT